MEGPKLLGWLSLLYARPAAQAANSTLCRLSVLRADDGPKPNAFGLPVHPLEVQGTAKR